MNELDHIAERYRGDAPSLRTLLTADQEWAICHSCPAHARRPVIHPLRGNNARQDYLDFAERHKAENFHLVSRITPDYLEAMTRREESRRADLHLSQNFVHNASVLEAWQTGQTLDLTGIGIASSATAGWCSNWIDNSSNLYLDILFWYYSQAVNTAAGGQKEHVLFAPGSFASADLPSNTAGNTATNSASTSATLTYLDYTANDTGWPMVKRVPYITTNKPLQSGLFGVAKAHDGAAPLFTWLGLINDAGPTIGTGGGTPTAVKYRGLYATVA